jgi:hypothetical protein
LSTLMIVPWNPVNRYRLGSKFVVSSWWAPRHLLRTDLEE